MPPPSPSPASPGIDRIRNPLRAEDTWTPELLTLADDSLGLRPRAGEPPRHRRVPPPQTRCLVVEVVGGEFVEARLADVTPTGAGLVVPRLLGPGTVLAAHFQNEANQFHCTALATVLHAASLPDGEWRLGCRFLQPLADAEVEALQVQQNLSQRRKDARGSSRNALP
jgi:hypothetical protein